LSFFCNTLKMCCSVGSARPASIFVLHLLQSPVEHEENGKPNTDDDVKAEESKKLLAHSGIECIGKQTGTV